MSHSLSNAPLTPLAKVVSGGFDRERNCVIQTESLGNLITLRYHVLHDAVPRFSENGPKKREVGFEEKAQVLSK